MGNISATHLPSRVWIYGSDSRCDIVVRGPDIAPRHCILAQHPEGFAVEDLGSEAGTWVNGERLSFQQPLWINRSDFVQLGESVPLQWPEPETLPISRHSELHPGSRSIRIGRLAENDIVLDYPMIGRNHARLIREPGGRLILEDLDSLNGTALSYPPNRIRKAEVQPDDFVFFGTFKIRVSRLLEGKLIFGGAAHSTLQMSQETVIGRDPNCGYPIDSPIVSFHHASFVRTGDGIEVQDLGSRNGTFVNGQRIAGRVALKPGSEVALGSVRLRLVDSSGRLERRDSAANVTIEAAGITIEVRNRGKKQRLLDATSLSIFPSELVALMGLAGAGKTTLMKALNGYTCPVAGHVLFNGEDLYANRDRFRLQVGYVPQDDILHPQLTVREALFYTAKLRTDLTPEEISARTQTILTDLGIDDIGDRLIGSPERKVISGGQRKRVNIAMELLSDPSVLFLDEPTSGLSSYDASQVIGVLRRLADGGKTIVCTIHQPSTDIFRRFDSLIVIARDKGDNAGRLAFFGPAYPESIEFFNPPDSGGKMLSVRASPEQLTAGLALRSASEWSVRYQSSRFHHEYVEARAGRTAADQSNQSDSKRPRFSFGQFVTLLRRSFLLKMRDRAQTLILVAQAPLFAALLAIVLGRLDQDPTPDPVKWAGLTGRLSSAYFLMTVASVWFGCNNAAREIVGETAIFLRERMVNLKLPSYVFSKFATLALICLFQCTVLVTIIYFACGLKAPALSVVAVMYAVSLVGVSLGLLISALAPTTESAIAFLPVVLLPFILLAGGIRPLYDMPGAARWIASICPTRWAYEASLLREAGSRPPEPLNDTVPSARGAVSAPDVAETAFPRSDGRTRLGASFAVLGGMAGLALIIVLITLRLKSG